jgi:DNA-binding winged helix-turn-helix (wHTH) protein/serine/threonine protein kinase/tetratricopeptide (TPR) repeat protein
MSVDAAAPQSGETPGSVWTFAGREFDESRLELRVDGAPVDIELKPLEILVELLERAGEVLTKNQLLDAVWPGLTVVEGSLSTAVHKLRKALRDDGSSIVVTVPRVGYRLGVAARRTPLQPEPVAWPCDFQAGAPVPGRVPWRLVRSLGGSRHRAAWLGEHPHTHERRVFKFVTDASQLRTLRREVTVFRFLRESLGDRDEFVRVLEWNFQKAPYFIESEYGGENLAEWADAQGGLSAVPLSTRIEIVVEIAEAVATAHAAGVLHRDLKPANILVKQSPGGVRQIKVADFGSASLTDSSRLRALGITSLTATGAESLTGTVLYLAPEVIAGAPATALSDVYALGVILYQAIAGDFRRPVSTGWDDAIQDPELREDIASATYGDATRRTRSAAEVAARLRSLDARRTERTRLDEGRARQEAAERRHAQSRIRRPWIALAAMAIIALLVISGIYLRKAPAAIASPVKTVAVLPLQDVRNPNATDYLGLALADELATALSYARGLSVRPFSATQKFLQAGVDPRKAGIEMKADSVVTGHFVRDAGQLQVTLEAIEASTGRLLWRDTIDASGHDMLELRARITARAQGPLASALGAPAFSTDSGTTPRNEAAYDLYLRAVAIPQGTVDNKRAIAWLEQSVALDPGFAPAWFWLGRRYYVEGRYGTGGSSTVERAFVAVGRSVALAPNYLAGSAYLTGMYAEGGDLAKAIDEARDLIRRRPDNADVHYIMSYALRYAGQWDEAAAECNKAYAIDRHTWNGGLRSCAILFAARGDYRRAQDFLDLDPESDVGRALSIATLLREGKDEEAIRLGPPHVPQWASYDMVVACARHAPAAEIARMAAAVTPSGDPEANYLFAANLAYCGQTTAALALLKRAVESNYCSYPAVDSDVFFAKVRDAPEFAKVRAEAIACQKRFLTRSH